jgi:guanylate kinase
MTRGPLIIVSGPSGSGKSTLIRRLLAEEGLPLQLSVSATTRPPRANEEEGVDYRFWSREQFDQERQRGAFLEWAEVHGNYYGTPRKPVEDWRASGLGVILDIDVVGAAQVRHQVPEAVSIFITTSRPEIYEKRLRERGTETPEKIAERLANARKEEERKGEYTCRITNDDLEEALGQFRKVVLTAFETERTC